MPDAEKLKPADPDDLIGAITYALRFSGRKRMHHADQYLTRITAERITRHLERSGFIVMRKPPLEDQAALRRGFEG